MILLEKEYFRIYARKEIHSGMCQMSVRGKKNLDYHSELLGENQLAKRIENWVFSEHKENNSICMRPISIKKGSEFSVSIHLPEDSEPVCVEISGIGKACGCTKKLIFLNHRKNEIRFTPTSDGFQIQIQQDGEILNPILEKLGQISWSEREFSKLEQRLAQAQKAEEEKKKEPHREKEKLERKIEEIGKNLTELETKIQEAQEEYRSLEEKLNHCEEQIRKKPRFSTGNRKLEALKEDLSMTEGERRKILRDYTEQIQFIEKVQRHYPDSEDKEKIMGFLDRTRKELEELRVYFSHLEEVAGQMKSEMEENNGESGFEIPVCNQKITKSA